MKKLCLLLAIVAFFITSCKQKIDLVPASQQDVDSLQTAIEQKIDSTNKNGTNELLQRTASSSSQEDFWKLAFKGCMASDLAHPNGFFNKQLLYLGPSNNLYLGAIFDNKARFRTDLNFLDSTELKKFIDTGTTVSQCNITSMKTVSIDFIVGAGVLSSINANLSSALRNADSIKITGGAWRIDQFAIDRFLKYIDTSKRKGIEDYKESLINSRNKVVTLIIKVNGFTADAYLKSSIDAGIQAQINNKLTAKLDSAKVSLQFKSSSNKEISISSKKSFYVFANVYKYNSLKQ